MYRTLSLTVLLLTLLCTCGRAQNEIISTEREETAPKGSGSLLVEFGDETWTLSLSSADRFTKLNFVTEARYRRQPGLFTGFAVVPGNDRYDLRMVHELIGRLAGEGWEVTSSNYNHSQSANGWGTTFREQIFYQFSVPLVPENEAVASGKAEQLLPVVIADRDRQRLRGFFNRYENGTASLLIEERVGGRWNEYYKLVGRGILTEDVVGRIRKVSAAKDKLSFRVEMANGNYDYHFTRGGNNGYYFSGLHFVSNDDCGMVQYDLNLLKSVDAWVTAFYQTAPCAAGAKPRQINGQYPVVRTWLRDFIPGAQRIRMEEVGETVFY